MRFNFTKNEFLDVIQQNPNFSFTHMPEKFLLDGQHTCSFYTSIPGGGSVTFHNFDANDSYHVQLWEVVSNIYDLSGFNDKEFIKINIETKIGLIFNDEIYKCVQQGFNQYIEQVNQFIEKRPSKYSANYSYNLKLYFDKLTHEFKGYQFNNNFYLFDESNKSRITPVINFDIKGGLDYATTIIASFPIPKDPLKYKSAFVFEEFIPPYTSVRHHWIARCGGEIDDTLDIALDGLERLDMAYEIQEIVEY